MCCLLASPSPPTASVGVLWGLAAEMGWVSILCHIRTSLGQQSLSSTWLPKAGPAVVTKVRALEVVIRQKTKVPGGIKESWEGAEQ